MDVPGESALVLDYGEPPTRQRWKRALRIGRSVAVVLLIAAVGAVVGRRLSPITWRTSALLRVQQNPTSLPQAQQLTAASAAALKSPGATNAVLQDLTARGHRAASAGDAGRWLADHLEVKPIPNSMLVEVSFRSTDARLTKDAVRAVVAYANSAGNSGPSATLFATPTSPMAYLSAESAVWGAVFGAVSGVVIVLIWRRSSAADWLNRFSPGASRADRATMSW
jgi:hypothetical protein